MKSSIRRGGRSVLAYGFIALVFAAGVASRFRAPPLIQISDISPARNFSRVRLEGALERGATRLSDGAVIYSLTDGTGSIAVFAETPPKGPLPRRGARLWVEGHLMVGAGGNRRVRVFDPSNIRVVASASSVSVGREGERVVARGRVTRVWNPPPGSRAPWRITLMVDGAAVEVAHWLDGAPKVSVGDELEVSGRVDVYAGEARIKVSSADGIRRLD